MPITSGRIAAIATRAAPISLPTSMRPVVSIVTCTCNGTLRPAAFIARRQPIIAALACSRSHAGLDEEQVDAAFEQAGRLHLVGVAELGEADVPEARQLGAGPDRSRHVAPATVGGVVVGHVAGDAGRGDVELVRPLGDVVLVEHRREAAEAGGLDGVDADVEERPVHARDHVGPGQTQHLVAALERRAAEVVGSEVEVLHVCAERAVEHDHALGDGIEVGLRFHATLHATAGTPPRAVAFSASAAVVSVRATERQRGSGQSRPAWPGNAVSGPGLPS